VLKIIVKNQGYILWHIQCRPIPTQRPQNNETTAVDMQWHGKHNSTTKELLLERVLCNPLLGSCNSWTTTMETGLCGLCRGITLKTIGVTQLVVS
jgi:hypothetical protein